MLQKLIVWVTNNLSVLQVDAFQNIQRTFQYTVKLRKTKSCITLLLICTPQIRHMRTMIYIQLWWNWESQVCSFHLGQKSTCNQIYATSQRALAVWVRFFLLAKLSTAKRVVNEQKPAELLWKKVRLQRFWEELTKLSRLVISFCKHQLFNFKIITEE